MPEPLLIAEGLSKSFRPGIRAVDGVSFRIERGDVFGFLGPNGAGKSTTIRMILGLIHPTAGRVSIGGFDLRSQRVLALRRVGAFVEAPSFYNYLSGRKNLEIFSALSGGVTQAELMRVLALVGLKGRENDPVHMYSHGMRQRLGIAGCLLPRPELLVLDEPTDGLDPHGIHEVRELVRRLAREEGLTVFLSSHLLGEVENLCTRIAILEKGRVVLYGPLAELESTHRRHAISVDRPERARALLLEKFGIERVDEPLPESPAAKDTLLVALDGRAPEAVLAALVQAGIAVKAFAREEAWLERLFLDLTTTRESSLEKE